MTEPIEPIRLFNPSFKIPANKCMLKVSIETPGKCVKKCSKLAIKPKRSQHHKRCGICLKLKKKKYQNDDSDAVLMSLLLTSTSFTPFSSVLILDFEQFGSFGLHRGSHIEVSFK